MGRKYKLRVVDYRKVKEPKYIEVGPGKFQLVVTDEDLERSNLVFQLERINYRLCFDNYLREEMLKKQKPLTEEDVRNIWIEAYNDYGQTLKNDGTPSGYIYEVIETIDPKYEYDFLSKVLFWERIYRSKE